MKMLIIEDDHRQAELIYHGLKRYFPRANIDRISTESEFVSRFEDIANNPPDYVVLDVILRWTDPSPEMDSTPAQIKKEGFHRAGLRCAKMLMEDKRTSSSQVIIYSVLEFSNIEPDLRELGDLSRRIIRLRKDYDVDNLVNTIRSLSIATSQSSDLPSIFIVHGQDSEAKEVVARFIERLGLSAIILHEQASSGKTIIEKIEKYSDVDFAVILLTPDDEVVSYDKKSKPQMRARQNVIFELGFFIAKLGRQNVCALYKKDVEIPSDYYGVLYIPMDSNGAWRAQLASEMKAARLPIDMNKII